MEALQVHVIIRNFKEKTYQAYDFTNARGLGTAVYKNGKLYFLRNRK